MITLVCDGRHEIQSLETAKEKQGLIQATFIMQKIEGKSEKRDPFMALVHSVIGEEMIPEYYEYPDFCSKSMTKAR